MIIILLGKKNATGFWEMPASLSHNPSSRVWQNVLKYSKILSEPSFLPPIIYQPKNIEDSYRYSSYTLREFLATRYFVCFNRKGNSSMISRLLLQTVPSHVVDAKTSGCVLSDHTGITQPAKVGKRPPKRHLKARSVRL